MLYGSVLQHGGRIELDSLPGVGATFRIHLPAGAAGVPSEATVLVVEDVRPTADRLVDALRGHGSPVLSAPSAEEALPVAARHRGPIDLLITGVMLAGLNGGELAARLRRDRPGLRALFVVEDIIEPDPRLVLHAPESWLVHRKFSPESLLEKVAHVLRAPALQGEPAR